MFIHLPMSSPSIPSVKSILIRLSVLVLAIALACLWVLLSAGPVFAQAKTINYSNTELNKRDFSHTDMEGSVFVSAEMREVNFQGTNLKNSILTMGNLLGANLEGANLEGALIDRATLYKANLTNAVLVGATLTRSLLDEATITGADFTDALIDRYANAQLCQRAEGINPVTGIATRESLGCR